MLAALVDREGAITPQEDASVDMPLVSTQKITIVDVYELAAIIGKEFELLIDRLGPESLCPLMPKVVHVLELLEDHMLQHERDVQEISELQCNVTRLQRENDNRVVEWKKYEKDMETVEESWCIESQDLQQVIETLEAENKKLREGLKSALEAVVTSKSSSDEQQTFSEMKRELNTKNRVAEAENGMINKLKKQVDRQRCELRALKKDLSQKSMDLQLVQEEVERLMKQYTALRQRNCVIYRQSEQLLMEKSVLETELQAKEQALRHIRGHCFNASGTGRGSGHSSGGALVSSTSSRHPPSRCSSASSATSEHSSGRSPSAVEESLLTDGEATNSQEEEDFVRRLNAEGKMIIHMADAEHPRFSMNELKEVLQERNELKLRLQEVEQELSIYRKAGDFDPPVEGPLNKEPEDKLFQTESEEKSFGIKQFFQSLLERIHANMNGE